MAFMNKPLLTGASIAILVSLAACSGKDKAEPAKEKVQVPAAVEQPKPVPDEKLTEEVKLAHTDVTGVIHPATWPQGKSGLSRDPAIETQITSLLASMTLEQKVGQTIQADIGSVTPEDVRQYRLGTILNGGSSGPYGDDRALPSEWVKLADEFWVASMDPEGVETPIPVFWGIDAVHGHSNVIGATIFPHNIGLGAANDPVLIEKIGAATAKEVAVTGLDWTFAPTLAVARDDRWGRTYESYSESPEIVARYGGAMVRGIQGKAGTEGFLGADRVVATAKHFIADGGTSGGKDQGDALISETELRTIHAAGYFTAIDAGVQSVMASFSSWHGVKMHGNRALLNDVLFDRLGFDGFVVGDWNAHGKIPGCTNEDCPDVLKAGVDVYMAPDSWKPLYASTLAAAKSGEISMQRLDEAVARILRVKIRAGAFKRGRPSARQFAGKTEFLGSPEHQAIAREAVRKSLVLLKNHNNVLPLSGAANILVIGAGADSMSTQTGGWTISWQGLDTTHEDFPKGQTILEGITELVSKAGGKTEFSKDGTYKTKPDVVIAVYGELPYAEFKGDLADLAFKSEDDHLAQLRAMKAANVPVVSVFLSGRPLWVNAELNASDAFVAAWLPGTEGGGIADVLFEKSVQGATHEFTGKLSFSWPRSADQTSLNVGDAEYDPLFAYGYGLSKTDTVAVSNLDESIANAGPAIGKYVFKAGHNQAPWALNTQNVSRVNFDRFAQEDAARFSWQDDGMISFDGEAADMNNLVQPDAGLILSVKVETAPIGPVFLSAENASGPLAKIEIGDQLRALPVGEWQKITVALRCLSTKPVDWTSISAPVVISANAPLVLGISDITIDGVSEEDQKCAGE